VHPIVSCSKTYNIHLQVDSVKSSVNILTDL